MSDTALRDHGLDLAAEGALEEEAEFHFEICRGLDEGGVEEDLVGFAEAEGEVVVVH